MSLFDAQASFGSVTLPDQLNSVYVPLKTFEVEDPQAEIFGALNAAEPARLLLIGAPGTGKSSALHSALTGLRKMSAYTCASVFLTVGDVQVLTSDRAFLSHVLQTLSADAEVFGSDVDQAALEQAGATSTTVSEPKVVHAAGINTPVVSYSATLHERSKARHIDLSEATSRKELFSILSELRDHGYKPALILDDTEKFAARQDGTIDAEAAANLFKNGVDAVCSLDCYVDIVVAIQPRYLIEAKVIDAYAERHNFARVAIPHIPRGGEPRPLTQILDKRLHLRNDQLKLKDLVEEEALVALETIYGERDFDLRQVLNLAASAARKAMDAGSAKITAAHVYAAQEARPAA